LPVPLGPVGVGGARGAMPEYPEAHGSGMPDGGVDIMQDICNSPERRARIRSSEQWVQHKGRHHYASIGAGSAGSPYSDNVDGNPSYTPRHFGMYSPGEEKEEEHKNWKCFITLDTDRDGHLTESELCQGISSHGIEVPTEALQGLFQRFAASPTPGMTQSEFRQVVARHPILRDAIFERCGAKEAAAQAVRAADARAPALQAKLEKAEQMLNRVSSEASELQRAKQQQLDAESRTAEEKQRLVQDTKTALQEAEDDLASAKIDEDHLRQRLAEQEAKRKLIERAVGDLQDRLDDLNSSTRDVPRHEEDASPDDGCWKASGGMWFSGESSAPGREDTDPKAGTTDRRLAKAQEMYDDVSAELEANNRKRQAAEEFKRTGRTPGSTGPDEVSKLIEEEIAVQQLKEGRETDAEIIRREDWLSTRREEVFPSAHRQGPVSGGWSPPRQGRAARSGASPPHTPARWQ